MSKRMTHEQKELCLEYVRVNGTFISGAKAAGVSYQMLRNEMEKSPEFARRINIAQDDGKSEIGDNAIANIKRIATEQNKDVRSRLTANLALANWAVPGFRGESMMVGKIRHNIRVNTAIPRPVYTISIDKETPADAHPERRNRISAEDKAKMAGLNEGFPAPTMMMLSPPVNVASQEGQ